MTACAACLAGMSPCSRISWICRPRRTASISKGWPFRTARSLLGLRGPVLGVSRFADRAVVSRTDGDGMLAPQMINGKALPAACRPSRRTRHTRPAVRWRPSDRPGRPDHRRSKACSASSRSIDFFARSGRHFDKDERRAADDLADRRLGRSRRRHGHSSRKSRGRRLLVAYDSASTAYRWDEDKDRLDGRRLRPAATDPS